LNVRCRHVTALSTVPAEHPSGGCANTFPIPLRFSVT
jgi:hypothetical protein